MCQTVELPTRTDARGKLTFVEGLVHVPFEIRRIFYLYGIPEGQSRGAHAHKELHQFLICLAGGFSVEMDDGCDKSRVRLDRPSQGLHIPPMIWASEIEFDAGSICLVLASANYDENDYYRDYNTFLEARKTL